MLAIPVGPVALLIIQRSLQLGSLRGLASGIGAACADGLYGLLAAMGLAALIGAIEHTKPLVRPLGSLVLVTLGVYFYFKRPPQLETEEVLTGRYLHFYLWDLFSTFLLTLMNPLTIIAFAALFVGSDLIPEDPQQIDYLVIATGVLTGSFLWWSLLVILAQPLKRRISPLVVHRVLQVIGLILISLALVSLIPRFGTIIDKVQRLILK